MNKRIIFINGKIYSGNDTKKYGSGIAVDDGVITKVGSNTEIKSHYKSGYNAVDLKGKFVMPAITDAHLHLLFYGSLFSQVDLDNVNSLTKAVSKLKKFSDKKKSDQWVTGYGWNKNLWDGNFPVKSDIDFEKGNPIALYSKDGHLLWVNSKALEIAGITKNTPDPPGGVIMRDDNGEPTGILQEKAKQLVSSHFPVQTKEEMNDAILLAQKNLLKLGIVGTGNCDTEYELFEILRDLDKKNKLRLRVFSMIDPKNLDFAIKAGLKTGAGTDHFRVGCLKIFTDGALGSQTAFMFKPYENSANIGVEATRYDKIVENIEKAVNGDISVAIHAIGDKANYNALKAIGKFSKIFAQKIISPRIEHAQLLREQDIPLFNKFGIIASVQPIHATSDRDVSDHHWGNRARFAYAFKSLISTGAKIAFGSDAPVENANPFAGIHAAVTRKRPGETRKPWYPQERITLRQAIEAYTRNSAQACEFFDITGSIEPGKKADFIVLSEDPLRIQADDIHRIEVLATIVDGEIVYGRNNLN